MTTITEMEVKDANIIALEIDGKHELFLHYNRDVFWMTGCIYGAELKSSLQCFKDLNLTHGELIEMLPNISLKVKHKVSTVCFSIHANNTDCKFDPNSSIRRIEVHMYETVSAIETRKRNLTKELALLESKLQVLEKEDSVNSLLYVKFINEKVKAEGFDTHKKSITIYSNKMTDLGIKIRRLIDEITLTKQELGLINETLRK